MLFLITALVLTPLTTFASNFKRKVAKIEVKGNKRTKTRFIMEELTFSPGDQISDEDIENSRQQLLNLELFSKIEFKETTTEIEGTISIKIILKEKWSILPLPIISRTSDADVRLGLRYEDFNLGGRGHYLVVKVYNNWANDLDDDLGGYYSATVETTNFLWHDLIFSPAFTKGKSLEEKYSEGDLISTYQDTQESYSIKLGKEFDDLAFGIDYTSRRNDYTYLSGLTQPLFDIVVKSFGFFSTYSKVNNLGSYTYEGYEFSFYTSVYNKILGSDVNAVSYNAVFSQFIPLDDRKNFAYRLEGTLVTGEKVEDVLTSVGGSTSLRGYESGEFEGDRMLRFNTEYRVPLTDNYWGGVAFIDAGNAWQEGSSMNVGDLNWGVGFGLRLFIKELVQGIGRADFAYNVSQKSYKSYFGVRHTF
ncbi:MAG: BamA/TamA family outer membrane protein [Proteobacteria bacterium]|nr:BamA/TamA family outer membrane protein [Pseudomonadota bacterium]